MEHMVMPDEVARRVPHLHRGFRGNRRAFRLPRLRRRRVMGGIGYQQPPKGYDQSAEGNFRRDLGYRSKHQTHSRSNYRDRRHEYYSHHQGNYYHGGKN
ncbi:MAG: hypothetical protein LBD24_05670, partial [Spirochaetaceae bacterium]|nr:hypothetical protein [Spirochaetaceae bacterium]